MIDNLETAAILALRIQQVKTGQMSVQELTRYAQALFATSRESAVREIVALETDEPEQENSADAVALDDNTNRAVTQPISNEPRRMARVLRALDRHGYTKRDLDVWLQCITAPQLHTALEVMEARPNWPKFLILFTLRRYCNSRLAAYNLARWFAMVYPMYEQTDPKLQSKMLFRVVQGVQKWVPDLVPNVCEIAMAHMHASLCNTSTLNQLLWQLSRFGLSAVHPRETAFIMRAQALVVDKMAQHHIALDTKGYLAVGYTLREESPDRAKAFVDVIKQHEYPVSNDERVATTGEPSYMGAFPYLQGVSCLELLMTESGVDALNVFDSIERPNSMQWALLFRQLRRLKELNADVTKAMWDRVVAHQASSGDGDGANVVSPYLLSQTMMGFGSIDKADQVLRQFPQSMSLTVAVTYIKLLCKSGSADGLNRARQLLAAMEYKPVAAYNALLSGELRHGSPHKMWAVYDGGILNARDRNLEPDVWTLYYMCRAAWDRTLEWDGLFAAQRMVVEFKHWVRGAYLDGGDSADLLKLYPSDPLLFAYIVMLGRAGYHDDLLEILPWLQRIGYDNPSKLCLSALIVYAPNGKYLQKHAQVAGVGKNWPTEFEVRQFENYASKL